MDDGSKITQGSTNNSSVYEGLVPLFVITDNTIYWQKFQNATIINKDKISHFNIYPTILYIFGFDREGIEIPFARRVLIFKNGENQNDISTQDT